MSGAAKPGETVTPQRPRQALHDAAAPSAPTGSSFTQRPRQPAAVLPAQARLPSKRASGSVPSVCRQRRVHGRG